MKMRTWKAVVVAAFFLSCVNQIRGQSAQFVGTDKLTQGNWPGVYGTDGHSIANDPNPTIPSYATFSLQNQYNYTWTTNTSDQRALENGAQNGSIASCWFSYSTFSFDVNFTDGNAHQLALYALDWDFDGRAETIQIQNATTSAVLDTENIFGFTGGIYLVWNITGHVTINVTLSAGVNDVVSGIFFGTGINGAVTPSSPVTINGGQQQQPSAAVTDTTNQNVTSPINLNVGSLLSTTTNPTTYTIAAASQPLAILTITVPSGVVGSAYSTILVASGGVGPYTWSLGSGMLPAGLSLNSAGTISGIPTALSDSSFTIEVQDSMGNSITQSLNISIAAAVLSSSDSLLNTGMATSASYAAPGTDSETAIVASSTNVNSELWELVVSPWDVNAGSGTIKMSYSGAGSIVTQVNLTGLDNQAVNGYPFIFYGGDQWGDQIGGQPPQFPAQLSAMSSLVADATYSLTGTFGGDIDVLYDEWLIPSKTYTGGSGGALEVEVLPYCQFADFGGFTLVKTFSQTVTLNGVQTSMNFDEYSSGQGGGNAVLFIPVNGVISGEVRLDLLAFMNEGATTAGLDSSWWLSGIELGTEFGDGSTENFTFTVTKLDIEQSLAQVVSAQ